jgi:hypothetical protein
VIERNMYAFQHTPAQLEFDVSYSLTVFGEEVLIKDHGVLCEHNAPLGKSELGYATSCIGSYERGDVVQLAIEKASNKQKPLEL